MGRKIRIGIDVGGTFTDAVALDNEKFEIIGMKKIHTTHESSEGVTKGVITILHELLESINADADDVVFIAHGTTQATNALLEGDVADIGIVGMGSGLSASKVKADTDFKDIPLGDGKRIKTAYSFVNTSKGIDAVEAKKVFEDLKEKGYNVVVAAEAFSVDNPENEKELADIAIECGMLATSSHEISKLYGLKSRTKTAIINASILPKMMQTADMTSKAVKDASIKAPLMIMRSDGGVMQVNEVKKRPILTVLSGPAAGVAGALMYEKISDGIFLEVGGTSTDISAIQNGKVITKYAKIGGHSTYVTSLDINTIGIAGGSMIRFDGEKITNVGPRSSHIAGLKYACFQTAQTLSDAKVVAVKPTKADATDFLALECKDGTRYAVTLTCAANFAGLVAEKDYARANQEATKVVFSILSKHFKCAPEILADTILKIAIEKVAPAVLSFIKEYRLDKNYLILSGGGGGASAVVPYLAKYLGMKFKVSENAPYISTIGAALAMVRDSVERTIINPSEEDILKIREEAFQAVLKAGAAASTVNISIEIDTSKNIVKAVAVGTTDINSGKDSGTKLGDEEILEVVKGAMLSGDGEIILKYKTDLFNVYNVASVEKKLFGLIKAKKQTLSVVDNRGVIKLNLPNGKCAIVKNDENMIEEIKKVIDKNSIYDEAGKIIPDLYIVLGSKIANLAGLLSIEQAVSVLSLELKMFSGENIAVLIKKK